MNGLAAGLVRAVWLGTLVLAASAFTAGAAEPMEEVDYLVLPVKGLAVSDKIEVLEFFYYGCEACNRLEAPLQAWAKTLAADVSFRRIPALRRTAWVPLARLYFALEQLGELERVHAAVYRAAHDERLNLANSSELHPWARNMGIDPDKLEQLMDSDLVSRQVQAARDATVAYGIRVTPSFVVDGKYLTSASMLGSLDALLPMVQELIGKARAQRAHQ